MVPHPERTDQHVHECQCCLRVFERNEGGDLLSSDGVTTAERVKKSVLVLRQPIGCSAPLPLERADQTS